MKRSDEDRLEELLDLLADDTEERLSMDEDEPADIQECENECDDLDDEELIGCLDRCSDRYV